MIRATILWVLIKGENSYDCNLVEINLVKISFLNLWEKYLSVKSPFDLSKIVYLNLSFSASGFCLQAGKLNLVLLKRDLVLTEIEVKY